MAETRTGAGEPNYGPSLPELLRPRLRALPRWQRVALGLALALLLAGFAFMAAGERGSVKTYRQSAEAAASRGLPPIPFEFDHSSKMSISHPSGAYVRAERLINSTLSGRFTVSPFRIGRQPGLIPGFMPIVATRYEREAARRYDRFRLAFEGRARVNEAEGYQFAFTARLNRQGKPPRQLFGRVVMLPEPYDPSDPGAPYPEGESPTRGVMITMLATTLDNVPSATRVGDEGILQRPFRSFRFAG